jgi:hypothetical protein
MLARIVRAAPDSFVIHQPARSRSGLGAPIALHGQGEPRHAIQDFCRGERGKAANGGPARGAPTTTGGGAPYPQPARGPPYASSVVGHLVWALARNANQAADLLAEQPGATGAFQVTLLRRQTSVLISGAGAVDYHWAFSNGSPSVNAAPPPRHRPRNRRPVRLRAAPHLSVRFP